MKAGDLVRRQLTGQVSIVAEVIFGKRLSDDAEGIWIRLAERQGLFYASNYEVINEDWRFNTAPRE